MRRRSLPPTDRAMPPELAVFDADDWPAPGPDWPAEFPVRGYKRMKWQRARRLWRWEQEES